MKRLAVILTFIAAAFGAANARAQSRVICSSDDGERHNCSADTRGGVRLLRQISGSPCRQGETWGYDSNRIWVDRGCRAEFEVMAYSQPSYGTGNVIHCASDDERRHVCPTDTAGGVRMVRQVSGSRCDQGYSWGYDRNGVWVDHGCRADFEILPYSQPSVGTGNTIRCSSDDERRHVCPADTASGVRMVRQISGSPCTQGQTWGYDRYGIWVDRGCRAEFEILPYSQPSPATGNLIRCSSDDEERHVCPADTAGGVRMVRQISGSPCTEGRTWGYDRNGIWVDRGCRAEFEILRGRRFGGFGRQGQTNIVRCSSDDGGRHFCAADTSRGVRMIRQISGSSCRQGESWGFDQNGIWVDRGCRAEFETGFSGNRPPFRR